MAKGNQTTFHATASRYAAIMGRKGRGGVRMTFGGDTAFTDGRHINIPAMPAGTVMTQHQALIMGGYLDHEAAHVRHTDVKALELNHALDPVNSYLRNVIEDIRIENLHIEDYPGARIYLDTLAEHVDRQGQEEHEKRKEPLSLGARCLQLIYKEAYKYREVNTGIIEGDLDDYPEFAPIATFMRKEMPTLQTQLDTMRIAKGIADLIPKNLDYGQQAKNEKEEEPLPFLFFVIPGDGKGLPFHKALVDATGIDQHKKRKIILVSLMGDVKAQQEKQAKQKWGDRILPPVTTEHDKIYHTAGEDLGCYEATRSGAAGEISALKKMLNLFLRSKHSSAWSRGLEEGMLDDDELPSLLKTGNKHIFKDKRSRDLINTAIELEIDLSSSMNDDLTRMAAIVIAEAMSNISRLKLEISGFCSTYYGPGLEYAKVRGGRLNAMNLYLFKTFEESYHQARAKLGALKCNGGTPLGEAYAFAFERLLVRKENRRILWLISDGDAAIQVKDSRHNEEALMHQIHEKCRANKIEVVGLDIGNGEGSTLKKFVDPGRFVSISSERDLPRAVLSIMKELVI